MPIWNIITDLGVILFIFNCWTSWWMGMIENGTIRFQEQTWKRCELPYKSHPYRFMYRHLKTQLMVTKILSKYDKFAATFFTRTGFFFFIKLMFADTVFSHEKYSLLETAWFDFVIHFWFDSKWDNAAAASLHFNGRRREKDFSNFDT